GRGAGPALPHGEPGAAARDPQGRDAGDDGGLSESQRPRGDACRAHHHRRQDHRAPLAGRPMHPPSGPAWLVWLETSGIAVAMRQWTWLSPAVEIVHIVGFVTLVGAALMFDTRLLGRSRPLAVSALERHLLPWARGSLLLVVPTGALMFAAHATEMASNPALRLKLVLLVAAFL